VGVAHRAWRGGQSGPGRRHGRRLAPSLASALLFLAAAGCDSISREELRCEEAVSKIMACCAGLAQSPVVCEYRQSTLSPQLWTFPQVDCLVGLSCAELQARGTCAWAAAPGSGAACP
jgi:hypothetical protein